MHAMTGTNRSAMSVCSSRMSASVAGNADPPEIDARGRPPLGAAAPAPTDRTPASAPVSPTAANAGGVERRDEPCVDRARQHRDDDVERRFVGDAQAVDLTLLDAGGFQRRVDLLAAAVNDRRRGVAVADDRRDSSTTTVARCARSSSSSPPNLQRDDRVTQRAVV